MNSVADWAGVQAGFEAAAAAWAAAATSAAAMPPLWVGVFINGFLAVLALYLPWRQRRHDLADQIQEREYATTVENNRLHTERINAAKSGLFALTHLEELYRNLRDAESVLAQHGDVNVNPILWRRGTVLARASLKTTWLATSSPSNW